MKRLLSLLTLALTFHASAAEPLRVFIRAGKKSHGPNQHEHERFLADWKVMLAERGMKADGALDWPTAEQMKAADVIIVHAQSGGNATEEQKANIAEFTKRGGGLVVIHAATVTNDPPWWKSVIGGAWVPKVTKWKEGPMDLYFTENQRLDGGHPITEGASNFHLDDEIYYDLDLAPEIRVLATSYTPNVREGKNGAEGGKAHIFDIQPQIWAYEKDGYRAFVSIPGHLYGTFEKPNYRAILLRGIAWAGKRANVDEFTRPEETSSLTYPDGGPQRPEQTLKNLEVHPDFTIKLVAAEPLISKPMNFDWDPAGRLWVAETPEYPNGRRGMRPDYRGKEWKDHGGIDPAPGEQVRKGQDKISILTDSDGDGVMDKKQVFYEGLDLVTGLVFHQDGVIVTQAPDILFLRDTDGDGQADKVEKLYSGLGTRDTHAVINNPRWGWDGWIYATHGYSSSSEVKNARGEAMPTIGSGVVRFKPDGSLIEQYCSKGGNTWGLTITGDNRVMWTQPTSGTLLNQVILPESALARGKIGNTAGFHTIIGSQKSFPAVAWDQLAYRQIDRVGDFTAAAGCVIYDGGAWPAEYNGDYFTTEPTINIITHQRLKPEGSSYSAFKLPGREETEFIRSTDMWWRPIEVRVGPDGAMYVGDFYNQAVIHNDTRGPDHNKVNAAVRPDRDHYFGRIWKIEHRDADQHRTAWLAKVRERERRGERTLPDRAGFVPDLSKAGVGELAVVLGHPNRAVRMTASRLLVEKLGGARSEPIDLSPFLSVLLNKDPEVQVATLWTLFRTHDLPEANLRSPSADAVVTRNKALIMEADAQPGMATPYHWHRLASSLIDFLKEPDGLVRVGALRALAATGLPDEVARKLVAAWPQFDDDFQRSAAVGAASRNPAAVIAAALDSAESSSLKPLVTALVENIEPDAAARLVVALAGKPASADALKSTIFNGIAKAVKTAPTMTPELSAALGKLLSSGMSDTVLPIAAQWDKSGTLKSEVTKITQNMIATLHDANAKDDARLAAATSLLGLRSVNPDALKTVTALLGDPASSVPLQKRIVGALGETDEPAAGAAITAVYPKLSADAQPAAFDAVLKRADWAGAFLDAVKAKEIDAMTLGPAAAYRLRSHPDKAIAKRATAMLDELNPTAKLKKDAIAKLAPVVEQKGDAANGKALFATACAICHKFGETGADIGPALTGMGVHGPGELLSAIVDPNAEVEPSFAQWNLETKDGQIFAGVIVAENPATITLKSLAGVQQVKLADLKSRVNTGRSLMPEGFEGLGGETLRDIIAYMQSVDGGKFRTVDLRDAFTTSTAAGLYASLEAKRDTFEFLKTGTVSVGGIPFVIISPEKAAGGNNIVVLKGGPAKSHAGSLPLRAEVKLGGFKANRLHFLGGVTGWGFRGEGEPSDVMKLTVVFADGQKENLVLRNGVEFADYGGATAVPGSKATEGIVKSHQLRWFSKQLSRAAEIEKLILESTDTGAAPTTVAITAELADANAAPLGSTGFQAVGTAGVPPAKAAGKMPAGPTVETTVFRAQFDDPVPQPPAARPANGPRVLLVGGGSSHDFVKFFGAADKATLTPHVGWVDFTQNANGVAPVLRDIDVLVWSANQRVSAETRKALIDYVNAGKALIAYHPGTWYAWNNFAEWNAQIVGGGARGHDKLGEYEVTTVNVAHPIMAGVPASFRITDELYWFNADPAGTPLEVLATATSTQKPGTYPQVFVVKHPKAKIVGLTLGHDARAHDLPAFQAILRNAVAWAAAK